MCAFTDYDAFARAYDRHWGARVCERLPLLHELLLSRLAPGARILDVCCGTGQLAHALHAAGYRVTGIDGSHEQLALARRHAPQADFHHADARAFELPPDYDAAISLSDSLNHVMHLPELVAVFRNVRAALRGGGVFLFDLNMEHKYVTSWAGTSAFVEDDRVCVVRATADVGARLADFRATVFEKEPDGAWRRADVLLRQTWYAESEIRSAANDAGFGALETFQESPDKWFFRVARS